MTKVLFNTKIIDEKCMKHNITNQNWTKGAFINNNTS